MRQKADFDKFDTDGNGLLEKDELRSFFDPKRTVVQLMKIFYNISYNIRVGPG